MHWTYIVTVASLIGTVANIYKRRWCFVVWLSTNATWAVYDYSIHQYPQAILFAVYFALSILGLIKWKRAEA
jgi:hypothetical protein